MDLGKRVEMMKEGSKDEPAEEERQFEEMLLREHAVSTDMGSLDWKRMKIPPVLSSAQSARLFKTMQPMKVGFGLIRSVPSIRFHGKSTNQIKSHQAILEVQESLREELQRDPTDAELAEANNMTVQQLRRRLDVGRAARNKLIKVS